MVSTLVADGSDSATINAVENPVIAAGARPKLIAPKPNVKLEGGNRTPIDGQPARSPTVLLEAIAVVLSDGGVTALLKDGAGIQYVSDAFGHLKAIASGPRPSRCLIRRAWSPTPGSRSLAPKHGRQSISQRPDSGTGLNVSALA